MPDSTQQDIEARIKSAAMLAGINTVVVNPLNVNQMGTHQITHNTAMIFLSRRKVKLH